MPNLKKCPELLKNRQSEKPRYGRLAGKVAIFSICEDLLQHFQALQTMFRTNKRLGIAGDLFENAAIIEQIFCESIEV